MKFSVCVNSITGELSRPEAIRMVSKLGYSAVEFWEGSGFPIDEYKQAIDETGVTVACMGGGAALVDPAKRLDFIEDMTKATANAKILGAKGLIGLSGQELPGILRQTQHDSIVAGLQEAAKLLEGTDITINIEPLNKLVNHPGYYLSTSAEAFEIVRKVNSPNVKVLFDIYHQQITEGNLIANITNNIDLIGHFHVAGNPGRGEPYYGEINYSDVFKAIKESGYEKYIGLEYWAKVDGVEDSLKKILDMYS